MTAQDIYALAIHLMNEGDEESGAADTAENRDFKARALPLLNLLQQDCVAATDRIQTRTPGLRPTLPPLAAMTDSLALEESLCTSVLPFGLAGWLLGEINPTLSQLLLGHYRQRLEAAKKTVPAASEPIEAPYGGVEYSRFSGWQAI